MIPDSVKIGDTITLVAPSGARKDIVVTDTIRCVFDRRTIFAIEFVNASGEFVTLPPKFFEERK